VRKPKVSLACIAVCGTLGLPGAALAQDPGVHFDSGSPAGKEYAIPLTEGRAEGAGTTNQRSAADVPFGVGITPPGGGGGPARSGTTGGDGPRGGSGGADESGTGRRAARAGGNGRGSERQAPSERALSIAEAPVDTTIRTLGIGFGVVVASVLLALLLWWRREQPAGRDFPHRQN
jgi:hypothetical protein